MKTRHSRRRAGPASAMLIVLMLGVLAAIGGILPSSAEATTAIQDCGGCHEQWGTVGTNYTFNMWTTQRESSGRFPGSHATHAGYWYTVIDSRYSIRCEVCHINPMWQSFGHQRGIVEVNLAWMSIDANGVVQPGSVQTGQWGSYSKGNWVTWDNAKSWRTNMGTCSSTYCHSSGITVATGGLPTGTSPMWGTNPQSYPVCVPCHGNETGNPGTGAPWYTNVVKKNSHRTHAWQTIGTLGGPVCYKCHAGTSGKQLATGQGAVITSVGNHIKRTYTVVPSNANSIWYTYTFAANNSTCANASCHISYPGTGGNVVMGWGSNSNQWSCVKCHGVGGTWATNEVRLAAPGYNSGAPAVTGYSTFGRNTWNTTGTLTNGVFSAPRVWAHNSHLNSQAVKGYTTFRGVECDDCHDAAAIMADVWTSTHMSGTPTFKWSTLAKASATNASSVKWGTNLSPWYSPGNQMCGNIYCHGQGLVSGGSPIAGIAGSGWSSLVFSNNQWLTASTAKDNTSCNQCHMSPPTRTTFYNHGAMPLSATCVSCHGHNGDGGSHVDGILYGAGTCNSCHWYDPDEAGAWTTKFVGAASSLWDSTNAWGAHVKHINNLRARNGSSGWITAATDKWGTVGAANAQAYALVCGVCHGKNAATDHSADGGSDKRWIWSTWSDRVNRQFGQTLPSFDTNSARSCSNVQCHFKPTTAW